MTEKLGLPPKLILSILCKLKVYEDFFSITSDIELEYSLIRRDRGRIKAHLWLILNTIQAIAYYLLFISKWRTIMLRNYIKTAFRHMLRFKLYSAINIIGLAIGFSCFILISLFIKDELSYDKFHVKRDSIYRLLRINNNPDGSPGDERSPRFPLVMKDEICDYFPEIQFLTRLKDQEGVVRYKNRMFQENIDMADDQFFLIFSFPLIFGNPETALSRNDSIVLVRSCAQKYFGHEDPLGKTLTVAFGKSVKDYTVTGIAEDIPHNSSINFMMLINISNYGAGASPELRRIYTDRGNFNVQYFILLKDKTDEEYLQKKATLFYDHFFGGYAQRAGWKGKGNPFSLGLQNLNDTHLDPRLSGGSNPSTSYVLAGIALLVLCVAGINFVNLSVGTSLGRSVDIGMRKVLGAGKKDLIRQFCAESLLLCGFALLAGILLTMISLPHFNALAGKKIGLAELIGPAFLLPSIFIVIISAILVGIYPALVMANFRVADILKSKLRFASKKTFFKSFIVTQFALSVFLIITAVLLGAQLKYMLFKDVGYYREGLLAIQVQESDLEEQSRAVSLFKEKSGRNPHILGVTASTTDFGETSGAWTGVRRGGSTMRFMDCVVDYDFVSTLGLKIIEGRDFSREFGTDSTEAALVSRQFVKALGVDSPIGMTLGDPSGGPLANLRIIGVVEDFHFQSLRYGIDPAVFHIFPSLWGTPHLLVRMSSSAIPETMKFIKGTWNEIQPDKPFVSNFLDETIESYYKREKKWTSIVNYSSGLALWIACMGIFGLTTLTINRRVKEIGIRKVLGAKVSQVLTLIFKDFIVLVVIANVIAWPFGYFTIHKILINYPFRIEVGISYFIFALIGSISIAVITISYLALKAALANPIAAIRNE